MKKLTIRLLTKILPRDTLRRVYISYANVSSFLKYGDYKFPRIITIEISSHCNRACAYCPNIIYPQASRLISEEVISKLISRLAEIKYAGVVDFIFFNEPTLNPKLAEYVSRIRKAVPLAIPRISTNGDMLTYELVKKLSDAGLDRIYPMRHNPTPAGWKDNIETLSAQFPGLFQIMDIDDAERDAGLHDFNGLVEVKNHRGRKIVNGKARCQVHRHIAQFTIDGDWNLCCVDYAKTRSFGSLLNRSILEIWRDPEFVSARNLLESGEPAAEVCKTCTCLVKRDSFKRHDFVSREAGESLPKNNSVIEQWKKLHGKKQP